jgi:prolyl oligopeptidase PreP (S9A serine peptidase family)
VRSRHGNSPYQNVRADARYPAIMFFTGDSDTRVEPLHARKMTAKCSLCTVTVRYCFTTQCRQAIAPAYL